MLEKSFSLLFYLKKSKNYLKGDMPIYLRITVDGFPKEISTGRQCDPDRWNPNARRACGTKEEAKLLNAFLDTMQTKVYEVRRKLLEKNEVISADGLKNALKGNSDKSKKILATFQEHNDQMKSLVGKDFSPATLGRYKTSLEHTRSHMEWKYGVVDMDIRKMDHEFVSQYEFWLKTYRHCSHNTTRLQRDILDLIHSVLVRLTSSIINMSTKPKKSGKRSFPTVPGLEGMIIERDFFDPDGIEDTG